MRQLVQHTQLLVLKEMAQDYHARRGDRLMIFLDKTVDLHYQRQVVLKELLSKPPKLQAIPKAVKKKSPRDDVNASHGCQNIKQIDAAAKNKLTAASPQESETRSRSGPKRRFGGSTWQSMP